MKKKQGRVLRQTMRKLAFRTGTWIAFVLSLFFAFIPQSVIVNPTAPSWAKWGLVILLGTGFGWLLSDCISGAICGRHWKELERQEQERLNGDANLARIESLQAVLSEARAVAQKLREAPVQTPSVVEQLARAEEAVRQTQEALDLAASEQTARESALQLDELEVQLPKTTVEAVVELYTGGSPA